MANEKFRSMLAEAHSKKTKDSDDAKKEILKKPIFKNLFSKEKKTTVNVDVNVDQKEVEQKIDSISKDNDKHNEKVDDKLSVLDGKLNLLLKPKKKPKLDFDNNMKPSLLNSRGLIKPTLKTDQSVKPGAGGGIVDMIAGVMGLVSILSGVGGMFKALGAKMGLSKIGGLFGRKTPTAAVPQKLSNFSTTPHAPQTPQGPAKSPLAPPQNIKQPMSVPVDLPVTKGAKVVDKAADLAKPAGGIVVKTAEKTGAKTAAKMGAKALGKSALKKIPVLGALAGAAFAAQRAMQGDYLGASMELASGVASTLPGAGTAVSVGLDAALAARDMKNASEPAAAPALPSTNPAQPTQPGTTNQPKNPEPKKGLLGGFGKKGLLVAGALGGVGLLGAAAYSMFSGSSDDKKDTEGKKDDPEKVLKRVDRNTAYIAKYIAGIQRVNKAKDAKKIFDNTSKPAPKVTSPKSQYSENEPTAGKEPEKPQGFFSSIGSAVTEAFSPAGAVTNVADNVSNFFNNTLERFKGGGFGTNFTTADNSVIYNKINPKLKERFEAAAAKYKEKTGKKLIVTSGWRDSAKQKYLYEGWMARKKGFRLASAPGTSPHEFGTAIDINPPQASEMDRLGLLKPFGLYRPYYPARKDEEQHVQAVGVGRATAPAQVKAQVKQAQQEPAKKPAGAPAGGASTATATAKTPPVKTVNKNPAAEGVPAKVKQQAVAVAKVEEKKKKEIKPSGSSTPPPMTAPAVVEKAPNIATPSTPGVNQATASAATTAPVNMDSPVSTSSENIATSSAIAMAPKSDLVIAPQPSAMENTIPKQEETVPAVINNTSNTKKELQAVADLKVNSLGIPNPYESAVLIM